MSADPAILTVRNYFSTQAERFSQDDARKIGPELARLMDDGKRELKDVVEAARPDDAPLHGYFTWDDALAAERFRQMEAGRMVRAIQVRVTNGGEQHAVPAFTPISIKVTPSASNAFDARRRAPRPPGSGPLVAAQPWGRPHPPTRQDVLRGAEEVLPTGNTESASRILDADRPARSDPNQTERHLDRPAGGHDARQFVPEPGHTVWGNALDPSHPVLPASISENLDKLTDDVVIGRALARLLGFEVTFRDQRKRESFEAIFAPVFSAITWAVEQAGSGDDTG